MYFTHNVFKKHILNLLKKMSMVLLYESIFGKLLATVTLEIRGKYSNWSLVSIKFQVFIQSAALLELLLDQKSYLLESQWQFHSVNMVFIPSSVSEPPPPFLPCPLPFSRFYRTISHSYCGH